MCRYRYIYVTFPVQLHYSSNLLGPFFGAGTEREWHFKMGGRGKDSHGFHVSWLSSAEKTAFSLYRFWPAPVSRVSCPRNKANGFLGPEQLARMIAHAAETRVRAAELCRTQSVSRTAEEFDAAAVSVFVRCFVLYSSMWHQARWNSASNVR